MTQNKNIENLKLSIAKTIGKLQIGQVTINGKEGQVIVGADSLIKLLEKIMKQLK